MNFRQFNIYGLLVVCSLIASGQPKKPLFFHLFADYGMTSDKTTVVYEDYLGYIWIGTEEGLNKFIAYGDYHFKMYKSDRHDSTSLDNDYITSLYEDSQRRLWVGTLTGLCMYDRKSDNFRRIRYDHPELLNTSINAIEEHNDNLWIGTSDQLIIYNPDKNLIAKTFQVSDDNNHPSSITDLLPSDQHIWIGSSTGLYLVDDMSLNPVKGFENKEITSVEVSPRNTLLVGTKSSGLYELKASGKLTTLTTRSNPALTSNHINDVMTAKNGTVWIATSSGLTYWDITKGTTQWLQYDFNNFSGLTDHEVRSLYEDRIGAIWMTTPLGGVNYYHEADNQFGYYGQQTSTGKDDELLDHNVLSLHRDLSDKDKLWIGTRSGLSRFSETEQKFEHFPFYENGERLNNQILSISENKDGRLWLGTERGVFTWDKRINRYAPINDHTELTSRINVTYNDKDGNIWIGTRDKGLKRLSSHLEKEIDINFALAEDQVILPNINDIIQQPDGTIWVGTASGLYFVKNDKLVSRPIQIEGSEPFNSWVNYLCRSVSGQLLIGTRQEGLIMLDRIGQDQILLNKEKGLPSNDIRSMVRMGDSLIWVSTNAGLSKIKTDQDEMQDIMNFYVHDGLQGKQFTPRAGVDLTQKVYFGGLSGITSFDPREIQDYHFTMNVNLEKLFVNDKEIQAADDSGILNEAITLTDTIRLGPDQSDITIGFTAMDFIRPDSVRYKYRLLNYDDNWVTTQKTSATYTNLKGGRQYTFEVIAKSRFRDWSSPRRLILYIEPQIYETAWFQVSLAFLFIGILFGLMRYREVAAEQKQRQLERMVDQKTKELNQEISEKERTAIQLEKAKNDAEKANRIKSEFLANISHEIRTPLNGILGMSHLVSEKEHNPENREMLSILGRSAESLRDIIDDLLDLSKIEAGKFDIIHEEFNLPQLIQDVTQAFLPEVEMKSLTLNTKLDTGIPETLKGDELRIKQVLVNLISNAIKFTEKGSIQVRAKSLESVNQQTKVQISVTDTGIGIPKDKIEEVFTSFTQIDTGLKRKYGGTGLGLAISKKLVGLMNGHIWAESQFGESTTFYVELPLDQMSSESEKWNGTEVVIPERRKILLVEDNMVNTMVAVKMLQKTNQQVDTAIHGKEAIKKLENQYYDLILMDVQMPVMDGLETTIYIRNSNFRSAKTPIVALTAGAMTGDREKCLEVGMTDFIVKPISYDQLAKVLAKYLSNPEEALSMQK